MNEQKLREAVRYIGQEPLRLNMSVYHDTASKRIDWEDWDYYPVSPPCNTVMCIAGAIIANEAFRLNTT